jgi:hypothetical protein
MKLKIQAAFVLARSPNRACLSLQIGSLIAARHDSADSTG